jgi:hypothetical protein
MHVGMEKAIAKYLREENLNASPCQARNVDALLA